MFLKRFPSQASTPPFKTRKLIVPTSMQTPKEKKAEEERKAKEAAEAAEKAEEEKKATEAVAAAEDMKKAEEERLAAEKAEEMQLRLQSLEERVQSLVDTSNFVDEVFAEMEEEPIPRTQEEIVHMPNLIQEEIVHLPNIQDEIVHMPNIIMPRVGFMSPLAPKSRWRILQVHLKASPTNRLAYLNQNV